MPTKYVAPKPKVKPRTQQPVAIPRNITKRRDPSSEAFTNEIKEFYTQEAKSKFSNKSNLNVVITEKDRASKKLC